MKQYYEDFRRKNKLRRLNGSIMTKEFSASLNDDIDDIFNLSDEEKQKNKGLLVASLAASRNFTKEQKLNN